MSQRRREQRDHLRAVSVDSRAAAGRGEEVESISDAALVGRTLAGDRHAEQALFRRHVQEVGRLVTRLLGSRRDVEDIVQETFIIAFETLDRLREPAVFRGWLLRIAVNRTRLTIRKRSLLRRLGLAGYQQDASLDALADPGVSREHRDELVALDEILAKLPTEQRIAWMLHYVEGHTLRDVSRLCQRSLATTKRRVAAADRRIARAVDEEVLWGGR